ncbi:hypothetical protein HDU80_003575, partial [Chytriomyces hyalinus]
MNPSRSRLTLPSLRDAVGAAFDASGYLTAHPQYQQVLCLVHTNIHLEGSDTLPVSLWCACLSHVLGFPPLNLLAAALEQTFQESVKTYCKLRQPKQYVAPKSVAGQKRLSSTQPRTQRKQDSSECGHCGNPPATPNSTTPPTVSHHVRLQGARRTKAAPLASSNRSW